MLKLYGRYLLVSCFFLMANLGSQVHAALIDSTSINFSASGSPNTIAGSWSSDAILVGAGQNIEFFTVELIELTSDFGTPDSIAFDSFIPGNSRDIAFCGNTSRCVSDVILNNPVMIDSSSEVLFAWDFLLRLVEGNEDQVNSGNATIAFLSGGGSASVSGSVLIEAHDLSPIPIPAAFWLFGTALIGLVGFSKRRK